MSHSTTHTQQRERGIFRVTLWGSLVNFMLLVFKFAAGILGNSAAMLADAVHSLSDFITDLIVILFVRLSGKPLRYQPRLRTRQIRNPGHSLDWCDAAARRGGHILERC